jgi:hypothetical protein
MLTMICVLAKETHFFMKHLPPEKKLIQNIALIYESSCVVCRGKAYGLTFIILQQQADLLITFTQTTKLIVSLERDCRKEFIVKEEHNFIHKNINLVYNLLTKISNEIIEGAVACLESCLPTPGGRSHHHPTTSQAKNLKKSIPSTVNLKLLISNSQSLRTNIINDEFLVKFSKLIKFSSFLNEDQLNLDLICGIGSVATHIDVIISILETFVHHKEILKSYSFAFIDEIIPSLMDTIDSISTKSDLKVECLKILSDMSTLFFQMEDDVLNKRLISLIESKFTFIAEKLLSVADDEQKQQEQHQDPIPYYTLLILQLAMKSNITLISALKVRNILPGVFSLLQEHFKIKLGSHHLVKILNFLTLWSSTIDPMDLYENNIIDYLKSMFNDLAKIKVVNDLVLIETLIELLRIVDNLLKFVRQDFVKKAIQAKKNGIQNESLELKTEKLLRANRPIVNVSSFLISLLVHEDGDVSELACQVLYNIIQLFGCDCKDLVNSQNLDILSKALVNFDKSTNQQNILLKMSKRVLTSDRKHLDTFKSIGNDFIIQLKQLKEDANSQANVTLYNNINEILKLV